MARVWVLLTLSPMMMPRAQSPTLMPIAKAKAMVTMTVTVTVTVCPNPYHLQTLPQLPERSPAA
jgi:hypothetical protein